MVDKYISLTGGYGRVIAATGALELYAKNEQEKGNNIYVATGFPEVLSGLDYIKRVYPLGTPYLYEEHIMNGEFIEPEPYNDSAYYREEKHLAQVFNKLLNGLDEYVAPHMVLTDNELESAKQFVEEVHKSGKKMVLYQPWGSSGGKVQSTCATGACTNPEDLKVMQDESYRSFGTEFAKRLCERLQSENYEVYMVKTPDQMGFKDAKTFQNVNLRKIIALIPFVDGIICCDSFLHHASASLGSPVPTVVLWAGTNERNLGYKEQFNLHSWKKCEYEPNRIPHDHEYYIHKNKSSNEFKIEMIDEVIDKLSEKINTTKKE